MSNFWYSKEYVTYICARGHENTAEVHATENRETQIFPSDLDLQTSFCIWQPRYNLGSTEPALGKTIVSTGNLGLCFNLKEHRVRHWLHCTVILVFIASRDWWRCRIAGREGVVRAPPAAMDTGVRLATTCIIHAITYNLEKSKSAQTRQEKKDTRTIFRLAVIGRLIYRLHEM